MTVPVLPRPLYAAEARVLGTLVEKSLTTPDQYPLSLHAVRTGANQKTARDPVTDYDEGSVQTALNGLRQLGLSRDFLPAEGRVVKYEHRLGLALDLRKPQVALLAVLLLRGPQTPGELRQNVQRLHAFDSAEALAEALERLERRDPPLVQALPKAPGQREARYVQLLTEVDAALLETTVRTTSPSEQAVDALQQQIDALIERVAALERRLAESTPGSRDDASTG